MSEEPKGASREPGSGADAPTLLPSPERVLATLEADGKRRWLRPRCSDGRFLRARRAVAYALMAVFLALPHVSVAGKPAILLDLLTRSFTFFGTTFLATDTPLLMLFVLGAFVGVFLITALFGRAWCGWACPQTVYMEFLFRPLERLIEGPPQQQRAIDKRGGSPRRVLKNLLFVAISAFLAHTFLAYFVGWSTLWGYVTSSPFKHPTAFLVVVGVTLAMAFDFVWFREQTCLVACPYGRLQSVLLDRSSLIVGYDVGRGEPRGKLKKKRAPKALPLAEASVEATLEPNVHEPSEARGDCVACNACVITCPTGIDIRDGLQMECIGCAQCIDACDAIMERVGRDKGLIRYGTRRELEEGKPPGKVLRPRVLIYAAVLALVTVLFAAGVSLRSSAKLTLLRGPGQPYAVLPTGEISNHFRVRIRNQSDADRDYGLELLEPKAAKLVSPNGLPFHVAAGALESLDLFVLLPRDAYEGTGSLRLRLRITDGEQFAQDVQVTLLGPKAGSEREAGAKSAPTKSAPAKETP